MNPYNKKSFCVKCGEEKTITSTYHRASNGCEMYLGEDVCFMIKLEHILRHCQNCHWEWLEKPLNVGEIKP